MQVEAITTIIVIAVVSPKLVPIVSEISPTKGEGAIIVIVPVAVIMISDNKTNHLNFGYIIFLLLILKFVSLSGMIEASRLIDGGRSVIF